MSLFTPRLVPYPSCSRLRRYTWSIVRITSFILLAAIFLITPITTNAQSIVTPFGKNRVQYHNDQLNWTRYETENFMTYWYGKSRNIAQSVVQMAELDHDEIQKILEHTLSEKIEIVVYTDLSDQKQSNIGLEESFISKNDQTIVSGEKMMVYFNGDHQHLREQIRRGVATIYMNSILFGTSLQEIVQNALLLNLPPWFLEGISAYAGSEWDYLIDDELRDLWSSEEFKDFEKLAEIHPRVAGHSMWHYIEKTFGSAAIANIIYLARISRSLENSFLFITGVSYSNIKLNWLVFYDKNYATENSQLTHTADLNKVQLKNKKGIPISDFKLSPDGKNLAYIVHDKGRSKVIIRNMDDGSEQVLFKSGTKNILQETDYSYPLICWHPSYPELTVLYEKRDVVILRTIDLRNATFEEEDLTTNFQRVYSIDYIRPKEYLVSASTDGYVDLYVYKAENRHHTRITEDFYSELDATVVEYEGRPAVLFKSNRADLVIEKNKLDTILPLDNFDLFLLKGLDDDSEMIRLTTTPYVSEQQPLMHKDNKVVFLSAKNGILNTYQLDIETGKQIALTNLERNIIKHHLTRNSDQYVFNYYYRGNYDNFIESIPTTGVQTYTTQYAKSQKSLQNENIIIPYLPEEEKTLELTEGMKFQSEFDDPEDLQPIDDEEIRTTNSLFDKYFKDYFSKSLYEGKPVVKFNAMRSSATRERFRLDNFISRMDNEVLFEGLESYTGDDKELAQTPVGFLIQGDIKDLFEDYKISVGLRIPTSFNGYEYFVTIDDDQALWDKRYAFYRKSSSQVVNDQVFPIERNKRHTFLGLYRLKYPFDVYKSLRFTGSLRFDKFAQQASDLNTLNSPLAYEKRLSIKSEFVFDNSVDISVNILNGTRAKVFAEFINEFDLNLKDQFAFDPSKGQTGIVGFDARHYIPVLRRSIIALRGTGAASFGSSRVAYYLGGIEGWLPALTTGGTRSEGLSNMEPDIPFPSGNGNAYKVLAPQLRGFRNNIRNGNSYLLSNMEFRMPFSYLRSFEKSRFAFFRNMQYALFFDAGVAWYGLSIDQSDNPLNTVTVSNPPENPTVTIEARYFRNPAVFGYGFGLRSTMLGYFVKFDYAWGVETGLRRDPLFYVSLGKDF